MATKLQFVRDITGMVSDILPPSDISETLNVGSELTAFFDVPKEQSAYVVIFKYASNNLEDLTADRVNIDVRFFPYPPSNNTYCNPLALLIPGGARIYASVARPDVDTDVLVHASIYEAPIVMGGMRLQQGEAELVSIGIVPETADVPVGSTQQFTAYGYYSDETFRDITTEVDWRVDLEEVATIGLHTGLLTGISDGYAIVDAVLGSITSNSADVTVSAAIVVSLAITPINPSVDIGGTIQFTATATYSDGSHTIVNPTQWYSNNEEVSIIDNNGLADAVSEGTADIGCYITLPGGDVIAPTQTMTVTVAASNDYINYIPNGQFTVLNDYIVPGNLITLDEFSGKENQFLLSGLPGNTATVENPGSYGNISFYKYGTSGGSDEMSLEKISNSDIVEANPLYCIHHTCSEISNYQSIRRYYEFVIGDVASFANKTITVSVSAKTAADNQGGIRFVFRQNYGGSNPDVYYDQDSDIYTLNWEAYSKISRSIDIPDIDRSLITVGESAFSIIIEVTSSNLGATDEFDVSFTNVQVNKTNKVLPYQYIAEDKLRVYKRSVELPSITSAMPSLINMPGDVLTIHTSNQGQTGIYVPSYLSYSSPVPVGTVIDYVGEVDPPEGGWLMCDGREISKTQYPRLFNILNPTSSTPMYGNSGCYVQNTGSEQPNQIRVYNHYSYSGSWLQDQVIGLGGMFTIERLYQNYNVTRITCPNASEFDPTSGYMTRLTAYPDDAATNYYTWYIIFILDGNFAIPQGVSLQANNKIVYVHINITDNATQVATALGNAMNWIGFFLPDYRGMFVRGWNNGRPWPYNDPDVATRNGRQDGVSGDHVGTFQESQFASHNHPIDIMAWRGTLVSSGVVSRHFLSPEQEEVSGPYCWANMTNAGGNETRSNNVALTKIIKY